MGEKTQKARRGRPRNQDLDARILNTVQAILAHSTADQLTLPEVAKAAGVGTDSIYRRWDSKEALLQDATLALIRDRGKVSLEGKFRDNLVLSIVEASRNLLTGEGGGVIRATVIEALRPGGELWREILVKDQVVRREQTRSIVEHAQANGELSPEVEPDELLDLLAGAMWFQAIVYDHALSVPETEKLVDRVLSAFQ